jgi:hypothetical protein
MSTKVKTVNDLDDDAERRMDKELEKKKAIATSVFDSICREFNVSCENEFGVKPDLTQPAMHWVMNGWIAAQEGREWLSPEEIRIINMRKGAQEKRRKTMEDNRLKARGI